MFDNTAELYAARRKRLLGRRIRHRLRHLRPGEFRHQYLPVGGRFLDHPRQTPVRFRIRWPQGPVQLLQQPAVQRAVHLQWQYHRRWPGGLADRPFFGLDGWERHLRLHAADGDCGLRAGCLPRHAALHHQHWRALGALRARIRQVRARQPVQLAPVLRRAGTARLIPTLRRAWSSRRIRRKILTAKRSRHPIGRLSRPGSAWFGTPKAMASRPFAQRSL